MTCFKMGNSETLHQFCKKSGLCYATVWQYLDKEGLGINQAIEKARQNKGSKTAQAKYYYNGQTLKNYCLANNLSYGRAVFFLSKGGKIDEVVKYLKKMKKR